MNSWSFGAEVLGPFLGAFVAIIAFISILVAAKHTTKDTQMRRLSFLFNAFSMTLWCIGLVVFLVTKSQDWALVSAVIYYVSGLMIAASLYYLAFFLIDASTVKKRLKIGRILAIPTVALISVIILRPGSLIESITINADAPNIIGLNMSIYSGYCLLFLSYVGAAFYVISQTLRQRLTKRHRTRTLVAAWAMVVGLAGGIYFNLLLPLAGDYSLVWVGPLFVLPFVLINFYNIARYNLFDLRLASVRTVAYIFTLAAIAAVYFFFIMLLSRVFNIENTGALLSIPEMIVSLILVMLFQPIRAFFDKLTDRIFYANRYTFGDFFVSISLALARSANIETLMSRAASQISKSLQLQGVGVYLRQEKKVFSHAFQHSRYRPMATDIDELFQQTSGREAAVVIADLDEEGRQILRRFTHKPIAAVMFIQITSSDRLLILFGEKHRGFFNNSDLSAVNSIRPELKIAFQNSLSIHEVKKLNATLEQKIDAATKELRVSNEQLQRLDEAKDEFVSMASHQLRTPLTSIKGYLSIVLDGDAGEVSETQRQFLSQAFSSSERMVHLINDFLNVSRLQTGKFLVEKTPADLSKIVSQEVVALQSIAASHNMDIKFSGDTKLPLLALDEGKIRQVIMNFIDNAIYYSRQDSTILVSVSHDEHSIFVKIKDNGIGVPKAEQANLFGKFFRATNARTQRPDGTGVGLFLAKKVITSHGGSMIFESVEGKGSTFGFSLPLEKSRSKE